MIHEDMEDFSEYTIHKLIKLVEGALDLVVFPSYVSDSSNFTAAEKFRIKRELAAIKEVYPQQAPQAVSKLPFEPDEDYYGYGDLAEVSGVDEKEDYGTGFLIND